MIVDPDRAELERSAPTHGSPDVFGPDAGGQVMVDIGRVARRGIVDPVTGLTTGSVASLQAGCDLPSMKFCPGMALLPKLIRICHYTSIMARWI